MECQIRRADDIAELVLAGSLDSAWSPYFSDLVDEVIRDGALELRLDMSGVSYLSSNGIGLLVRYHRQLKKIGGRFRIIAESEAVSHVLRLTGVWQILHEGGPAPERKADSGAPCTTVEREGMVLQVFAGPRGAGRERLELIGDPARLFSRGYDAADERAWRAVPDMAAFGLGALGPSFAECRGRFGEFLAVAGIAAYRPSAAPARPDFEHAAGEFVPVVRMLFGMAFPTERATLIRFEASGQSASGPIRLSQIAEACLEQTQGGAVGVVLAAEIDGLVGAALLKSPAEIKGEVDPFAHPGVREWLSVTPEPEHNRSTVLAVGVATREPDRELAPFLRPLSTAQSSSLQGHFHAAVVPYRPLHGGAVEMAATVSQLFEPGRIETILHLLGDSRPIVGAGESTFSRGVIWYVSLTLDEGIERP